MFSIAPLHPLHNAILELVARYPECTIAELHAHLQEKYNMKTSLQHLYRVIAQLTKEQVLITIKKRVSLNLMWVSYISFYADRAHRAAVKAQAAHADVAYKDGEKRRYTADTLLEVETIWNHLLVHLYRELGGQKTLHKYYSHAWWLVGKHSRDVTFYKQLAEKGIRCLWLFGNDTPLDRAGEGKLRSIFTSVIATKPPFPKEGYNLNVYGDYVLECIFPEKIEKHMAFLFEKTRSLEEFDEELFQDIAGTRVPYTVTVWKNPALAKQIREKIAPFVA